MPGSSFARWRSPRKPASWVVLVLLAVGVIAIYFCSEDRTRYLLANSMLLVARTLAVSLPLGLLLAVLLVKTDMPGRGVLLVAIVTLAFLPLTIHASAWQAGLGLEGSWRLAGWNLPQLAGDWGAAWVHAMASTPWIAAIVSLGLLQVEPELEEEALLCAPPFTVLRHVTLRRAAPAIVAAALWTAAMTNAEITVTDLFQVRTFAEETYTGIALGDWTADEPLEISAGSALTLLFAAAALVGCWQLALSFPTRHHIPWRLRLRRGRWIALILASLVLLLIAGLPFAHLLYKAGVDVTQTSAGRVRDWSASKCFWLVIRSYRDHEMEFNWSLMIAASAATGAVAVAAALSWPARRGGRRAVPAMFVAALALAVPGPLVGLGLIGLLNRPEFPWLVEMYDRSILTPAIAQGVKALPLAILILSYVFSSIPRALEEAAALDGAGSWRKFWHLGFVSQPACWAGGWLAAFAVAWGELAATILVAPPGISTLPVRIFGLIHYGVQDQVAGVCLFVQSGVAILAVILVPLVLRQSRSS